ncbi:MAG: tRNA pseudouridine(38-40) synthase TruA [Candidatus Polarisedimenticolia bacterium]
MRNLKLTLAYVGTRYAGWQIQPHAATIQGLLQERMSRMLQEPVSLLGAGRTDAGVHARGQVASVGIGSRVPPEGLRRGLNARLPGDVAVLQVDEVPAGFHARTSARGKEYRYTLIRGDVVSPFERPFVAPVRGALDVGAMRAAAALFVGRHDFTSLCASDTDVVDRVRTLHDVSVVEAGARVEIRVRGDGFLRHMVRTLAGTLIETGRGRIPPAAIPEILAARDRRRAGPCAAPCGLVLERVFYGEEA